MTRPKLSGRRLGFSLDPSGRAVSDGRQRAEWDEDVRAFAEWVYLQTFAREWPDAMRDLAALGDDVADLLAWCETHGLTAAWCLPYVAATKRAWLRWPAARGAYWFDRDDQRGHFVAEDAPPVVRPLKDAEHFVWLVRWQGGAPWSRVAPDRDLASVRSAVATLAQQLRLPLRRGRAGRPPRR